LKTLINKELFKVILFIIMISLKLTIYNPNIAIKIS